MSTLDWPDEQVVGVNKDHEEITTFPSRSDEDGFFEQFMNTLVGDLIPRVEYLSCGDSTEDSGQWQLVGDETRSRAAASDGIHPI